MGVGQMALGCDVASVCIKPHAVPLAREMLSDSDVKVGTVVGFPHGNSRVDVKKKKAELTMADGAEELDVVVNTGKVLSDDWENVSEEIRDLSETVVRGGGILKVISENDYLENNYYRRRLCEICNGHQVAFVKTSTGYGFVKRESGMYSYEGATATETIL